MAVSASVQAAVLAIAYDLADAGKEAVTLLNAFILA